MHRILLIFADRHNTSSVNRNIDTDYMTIYPNAKINLGLNVTERRSDGYHNLETVFYPIPVHDILHVETEKEHRTGTEASVFPAHCTAHTDETEDYTLYTAGITIDCPPEKNLVIKAFRNLKRDFDLPYLYIYMYKQIPSGAGLGGGSSDAAFMMKLLNDKFNLGMGTEEMEARISPLGADCAFFIKNRPTLATGIGNIFTPVSLSLKGRYLVLVKPDVFVSTKEAYSQIHPHRPATPVTDLIVRPVDTWRDTLTNDFEEGIFALHPEIADIKARLYGLGADYAAMSGSGSSVFGLFRTPQPSAGELFTGCTTFSLSL